MQTHIVSATRSTVLAQATQLLINGHVIAFPTDTVYGIGTQAFDPQAVDRLFTIKGRPRSKPIPILIADIGDLKLVAHNIPSQTWDLAEIFWPGGLTIILPRASLLPEIVTAGGSTVAIRCPRHAVPIDLMRAINAPLAATSANLSGNPSPSNAQQVAAQLEGTLPLIIDGGECPGGTPSTLVDLCSDPPRLLRRGAIESSQLRRVLPNLLE